MGPKPPPSSKEEMLAGGPLGGSDGFNPADQTQVSIDGVEQDSSRRSSPYEMEGMDSINTLMKRRSTVTGNDSVQAQKQMFVDAAEMKRKLIEQLSEHPYDVRDFYHEEGRIQLIARSSAFENITLAIILLNSLWISIDTDMNDAVDLFSTHWVFVTADTMFGVYFVVELVIRFLAFRSKRNCMKDFWFPFDSCLVLLTVVETWTLPIIMKLSGQSAGALSGESSMLRMVRIIRLARMMRMARLMRACPEMVMLIKGMVAAMRAVGFTLVLLIIMIYVFAVIFRRITDQTDIGLRYFPNVPVAMHTLFLFGTLLDEVSYIAEEMQNKLPWILIPFYIFVLLSALTLMNMLIGVLCEVMTAIAEVEKESLDLANVKESMTRVLDNGHHEINSEGHVSRHQFMQLLSDPLAAQSFKEVDIDVVGLVDCADMIFEGDHYDDDSGKMTEASLTFGELMGAVVGLRGSKPSTVKDVVDLRKFLRKQNLMMDDRISKSEDALTEIGNVLAVLTETFVRTQSEREGASSNAVAGSMRGKKSMDAAAAREPAQTNGQLVHAMGKWEPLTSSPGAAVLTRSDFSDLHSRLGQVFDCIDHQAGGREDLRSSGNSSPSGVLYGGPTPHLSGDTDVPNSGREETPRSRGVPLYPYPETRMFQQ